MAVKIRLMRMGKKKQPTYRVVVADSRSSRDGRIIESIGRYDPRQEPSVIEVDNERAAHWLGVGAQPTDRARKLLEISGAWARFKIARGEVYTVPAHSEPKVADEPAAETAAADAPPADGPEVAAAVPAADVVAEPAADEVPSTETIAEAAPAAEDTAEASTDDAAEEE